MLLELAIVKPIKNYTKENYTTIASGKVPIYELICAAALIINIYVSEFSLKLIELCIFSILIITIAFIDFYLKIIPDKIVCIFAVVNFIFAVLNHIVYARGIFDSLILRDGSNSAWYIQAGQQLWFYTKFDFLSTYRFRVIETQPTSRIITDITGYTDGTGIGSTVPESGYYLLEITPRTSLGASINSYMVQIQ